MIGGKIRIDIEDIEDIEEVPLSITTGLPLEVKSTKLSELSFSDGL